MAGSPKKRARGGKKAPGAKGKGTGGPKTSAKKGDRIALKHGASEKKAVTRDLVVPRAQELQPGVFETNLQLDPTRDGAAVFRYCVALARIERVYNWLAEQDDEVFADMTDGEVHAVYKWYRHSRWRST